MISFADLEEKKAAIAVVGLGYVGLPLAVALAKKFQVIGFDVSATRIAELQNGVDHTDEVDSAALKETSMVFSCDGGDLHKAQVIIIAVPTPIDGNRKPDLGCVRGASLTVGKHMPKGCVVVYESTVYPGVTEEECVPYLEEASGFTYGKDFTVGYSPERINPGDKVHTVDKIVKVVSASTPEALDLLAKVYGSIVTAGIHKAPSIKVAEAAKVIENTQRDLNIALMNELCLIFDRLNINTLDVLRAAGTKWNFLPFRPGLVGGHCIGVDPYYLTFKAESVGYHPQVILAGRRINDSMGKFIAEKTIKSMIAAGGRAGGGRVGILGFTFKENVPDLRNTRVVDICAELEEYGMTVLVHDPHASVAEAEHEYGRTLVPLEELTNLDALIVSVAHDEYVAFSLDKIRSFFAHPAQPVIIDVKSIWRDRCSDVSDLSYWCM